MTKHLAVYPDGCRDIVFEWQLKEDENHFAVSLETKDPRGFGNGRLLVMADQSVFANGMMGVVDDPQAEKGFSFDNANWEFTNRTIDWVRGGRNTRTHCLFIEDGRIVDKFAVERPQTPKPPMPEITPELLLKFANTPCTSWNHRSAIWRITISIACWRGWHSATLPHL